MATMTAASRYKRAVKKKIQFQKFAEVYDSLMDLQHFYDSYYRFIIEILQKLNFNPKNILDLACGTGKLAEIFLKNCYKIEGVDLSEAMLKIARKRGLKTYRRNMVDFRLGKKYDLIVCIFDSLNYLQSQSQLQKCFASVYSNLNSGSLFVFDVNSDYKINSYIPKVNKTAHYKIGNTELIWENSHKPDAWIAKITMIEKTKDGGNRKYHETHVEKAYSLKTIRELLEKSGLNVVGVYGDFEFNKVKKDSLKWFFVCRRKALQEF